MPPCTCTRPSGAVLALLIVIAASTGESVTVLWLCLAALVDRRHRRDAGPPLPGQGDDPLVRRRAARQHRRLPDLRVRADGAALGRRLPAGRRARRRASPPCRCWRPATSSAGPTRRPTTTSSSASRATGTSSRSTRSCCDLGADRRRRSARRLHGAGVRAGEVPLPLAHRDALRPQPGAHRASGWSPTRCSLAQLPDPHPVVVALSLAYLVYYVGLSLYLTVGAGGCRARQAVEARRD